MVNNTQIVYIGTKTVQKKIYQENLADLKRDNFFSRIITEDKTRIHYWNPPTKQECMKPVLFFCYRHSVPFYIVLCPSLMKPALDFSIIVKSILFFDETGPRLVFGASFNPPLSMLI